MQRRPAWLEWRGRETNWEVTDSGICVGTGSGAKAEQGQEVIVRDDGGLMGSGDVVTFWVNPAGKPSRICCQ
jgi:hypothetical protein